MTEEHLKAIMKTHYDMGAKPAPYIISPQSREFLMNYDRESRPSEAFPIIENKYVPKNMMYFIDPSKMFRGYMEPVNPTLWGKIAGHYWVETIVGVLVAVYAIKALFFDNEPIDAVIGTITGILAMFGINYGLPGSKKAVGMYSDMEYHGEK